MSTIWTPDGELPVNPQSAEAEPQAEPSEEEMRQQMAELQQQLAETPAEMIVANHCFGLFELAALHLGMQPPNLSQASIAIDAMAAVVDKLGNRLGETEKTLRDGLTQLQMAYVQISQLPEAGAEGEETEDNA